MNVTKIEDITPAVLFFPFWLLKSIVDYLISTAVTLGIGCGNKDHILFWTDDNELSAHTVKNETVFFGPPDIISVAAALRRKGRGNAVWGKVRYGSAHIISADYLFSVYFSFV